RSSRRAWRSSASGEGRLSGEAMALLTPAAAGRPSRNAQSLWKLYEFRRNRPRNFTAKGRSGAPILTGSLFGVLSPETIHVRFIVAQPHRAAVRRDARLCAPLRRSLSDGHLADPRGHHRRRAPRLSRRRAVAARAFLSGGRS